MKYHQVFYVAPMSPLFFEGLINTLSYPGHYLFVCLKMVWMGKRTRKELRPNRQRLLHLESDGFVDF